MIQPDEWEILVHNELSEKGLVSWITPLDPSNDTFEAMEGVRPDVLRTDPAFKDWHRSYCKVSAAMTRSLGKDMMTVIRQPEYVALYSYCPALQRYRAIRSILDPGFTIEPRLPSSNIPTSSISSPSLPLPLGTSDGLSTLGKRPRQPDTDNIPYLSPLRPNRIVLRPLLELARAGLAERAAAHALAGKMAPAIQKTVVEPDKASSSKVRVDLKSLKKERVVKDDWGKRCWTCGRMGQDTHTTKRCTAAHLSVASRPPIMTRYVERPSKHGGKSKPRLEIIGGLREKRGEKICYRWQYERTLDGLCYRPDCALTHACSLCLRPDHRAVDCDTHQYLPLVNIPRPSSLPPKNVDDCYRQFHGLDTSMDF